MIPKLSKSVKKWLIGGGIVIVVFILIHFITEPIFGDEVNFRKGALKYYNNYFLYIYHRYFTWSSRFILDLFMLWIPSLPAIIWKFLDISVIMLLYWLLARFSDQHFETALLLCAYPFMHMGSAGWIATTTIYLWPFTAALWAFFLLTYKKLEEKLFYKVLYFVLIIYATNNEILACLYVVTLLIYLYCEWEKIKKDHHQMRWIFASIFICCFGIVNVLICPGNSARITKEVEKWMPQFYELNILAKLRICIVSTLQHFTSIPNVIFILFAFLLAYNVWKNTEKKKQKVCGLMPLLISVMVTGYYFVVNIIINQNLNYVQPDIIVKIGSYNFFAQMVLLVLAVIYLIMVLWALSFLYRSKEEKVKQIGIYMGGLASRFALLLSPTMLSSGTRIYFLYYMSLIWLEIDLAKKIRNCYILMIVRCILAIGIIINLCMVYMMQQKYS